MRRIKKQESNTTTFTMLRFVIHHLTIVVCVCRSPFTVAVRVCRSPFAVPASPFCFLFSPSANPNSPSGDFFFSSNLILNTDRELFHSSTSFKNKMSSTCQVFPSPNATVLKQLSNVDCIVYAMGSLFTSIFPSLVLLAIREIISSKSCLKEFKLDKIAFNLQGEHLFLFWKKQAIKLLVLLLPLRML
nr:uncharacterized protein LOC112702888 isoform X4 [Arachis hypogaea]XP_025609901.1 uncharacterized protein LOC112702888 isoform X4 [Arachis hypogaea]XP_029143787.1 uncharacterized protein LOC112702888 isoform X4 [Arachis hypogaea]XP_029143788.1 uncharacterized protein LOC112702888 isoform X4 [Arachis hypogaea]